MIPTIGFFNSKGGIGKTSLVYHLAWMLAERYSVLAVDLDPQTGLTEAFLDDTRIATLWSDRGPSTIYKAIEPRIGEGKDFLPPHRESIAVNLGLLVGDLEMALLEQLLAKEWAVADGNSLARTSFHDMIQRIVEIHRPDVVLVDLGPGLGAINRTALVACNHIVVPVCPNYFATQDLYNVSEMLEQWHAESGPSAASHPTGYVVIDDPTRRDYDASDGTLAQTYRQMFSAEPNCLGVVKWYASLMPMARDAHKPVFNLRPADGALGAHAAAVQDARKDYKALADRIAEAIGLPSPDAPR